MTDLQHAVDDAIDAGIARGRTARGQTPEMLKQARAEWARVRAAEDLGAIVEDSISSTPDLELNSFNLRQFVDKLRRGKTEATRSVNRALDLTPGARQAFNAGVDDLSKLFNTIEFPITGVAGFRRFAIVDGLAQMISSVMLHPSGQAVFRRAVIEGRGTASVNALALAANASRRALGLPPLALPREANQEEPEAIQAPATSSMAP